MNVEIFPADKNSAETLAEIQKQAFKRLYEIYRDVGSPYLRGADEILNWLERPDNHVYKIFADGELCGGVAFRETQPGEYYLVRIYVLPKLQNRGIAAEALRLCEATVKNAKRWYLDFPADQPMNRRCYEKAGYTDIGEVRTQSEGKITLALYEKVIKISRETIITKLREALEPFDYIRAFWLEGADGNGTADEYSDLDFWIHIKDEFEEQAYNDVETALSAISPLDYKYEIKHEHPQIRQRIYHLENTSEFLAVDFCVQLDSRPKNEYILTENDRTEAALVLFDKDTVIRYKDFDAASISEQNNYHLNEIKHRMHETPRVLKYIRRGQFPEAFERYTHYIIEPVATLLRLIYEPLRVNYGLTHISRCIPENERLKLEEALRLTSLSDMEEKIKNAKEWFGELLLKYENQINQ